MPLIFQRMEALSYDLRMRLTLNTVSKKALPPIFIVDIDERSLQAEGQWPWPRIKLAKLIERLSAAGASVIALDMTFPEAERHPIDEIKQILGADTPVTHALTPYYQQLDGDYFLAEVLKKQPVVLGSLFYPLDQFQKGQLSSTQILWDTPSGKLPSSLIMQGYTANLPKLASAAAQTGFFNIFPDDDGVIRSTHLVLEWQQQLYASLAVQIVRAYLADDDMPIMVRTARVGQTDVITHLEFAGKSIQTDATGKIMIPFLGKSGQFQFFSATDILQKAALPHDFTDAIVLVGTSARGLADLRSTPFQPVFPGVEVQATLVHALLHPDLIPVVPDWLDVVVILEICLLGLIMLGLYPRLQPYGMLILGAALAFLVVSLNVWLWKQHLNTPLVLPLLSVLLMSLLFGLDRLLSEHQQRQRIHEMFGQYVPTEHIEHLLANRSLNTNMESERREMTVLFSDIRQFTPLSEQLPTNQVQRFLNLYLTPLTSIIFQHQGTVDKYVGDMIMAFWGAPLPDQQHAEHAVLTALAMQAKLAAMQASFRDLGLKQEITAGIGVHSGEMTVGDMGSAYRRAYTVLGDAVNLGSRLQELTKYYHIYTLVSLQTAQKCPDIAFRTLDQVRVRGRYEPVIICEPIGHTVDLTAQQQYWLQVHDQAITLYFQGDWMEASQAFELLATEQPSDYYSLILKRMQAHAYQAPAEWQGIFDLAELS